MTATSTLPDEAESALELSEMIKGVDRPDDGSLRILIFTATYFVLDGVTLTIRRLESHMRMSGAQVKIISTVPEDVDPNELENGKHRMGACALIMPRRGTFSCCSVCVTMC